MSGLESGGASTIVVPCFNEERRLQPAAFRALAEAPGVRVLFVDDGSTDGTARVLAEASALLGETASVLRLERNSGKAEAVRRGLLHAIDQGATIAGYLDADLATPPLEMLRLLKIVGENDAEVALGSRVALLGRRIERKASRHYLGRVFATLASILLDLRVYDTQCGAKAFLVTPLLRAVLDEPFHARWAFDVELIGRLLAGAPGIAGLTEQSFVEMPLRVWTDVEGSKLRPKQFPLLGLELLRIHFALARRRSAAAALPPPAAKKHLA
ncbi:MAG TPA: glycosyltransferase [Myxococcales bacterium]